MRGFHERGFGACSAGPSSFEFNFSGGAGASAGRFGLRVLLLPSGPRCLVVSGVFSVAAGWRVTSGGTISAGMD